MRAAIYKARLQIGLFLLCFMWHIACAQENLLGVSAYTLQKVGRFEVEYMRLGEYEIYVPYEIEHAFVVFAGGRASGIVGCNQFVAPYRAQGGGKVLLLGDISATKKACASGLESKLEAIFLTHFHGKFIVQGDDERVELVGEDGFRAYLVPSLAIEP